MNKFLKFLAIVFVFLPFEKLPANFKPAGTSPEFALSDNYNTLRDEAVPAPPPRYETRLNKQVWKFGSLTFEPRKPKTHVRAHKTTRCVELKDIVIGECVTYVSLFKTH